MAIVLCIDDDESVARLVSEVVLFCKHEPVVFMDPYAAAIYLGSNPAGAMIVDYMMPKLDGIELCQISQETSPSTRRILLTAAPNEAAVRAAVHSGVVQMLIAKPPSIADIKMALGWL